MSAAESAKLDSGTGADKGLATARALLIAAHWQPQALSSADRQTLLQFIASTQRRHAIAVEVFEVINRLIDTMLVRGSSRGATHNLG
jgi:hypothetical protein